ncbi:hypothetical protein [Frisingicoccus sp.]|uniref:hypothetical protein n=1 Tax=Frisingicoccus sp. TaxID=1918627 RepID=UPI003AB4E806
MLNNKRRQFFKFIKYDLYYGILLEWKKYAVFSIIIFLFCFKLILKHRNIIIFENLAENLSIGDLFIYILKGMRPYHLSLTEIYVPEFTWIFMYIYIAFSLSFYPLKDLHGYGQLMLLQSKQRKYWWFSKCMWNILSIILFYFIIIICVCTCSIFTGNMNIMPQANIQTFYNQMTVTSINEFQFILIAFLALPFVTIAISLFQMMWAVLIHPLIGLIVSASIYILSIFISKPWMLGNYLMLMRNHTFISSSEIILKNGILYSMAVICISVIIGYIGFRRKDILTNYNE